MNNFDQLHALLPFYVNNTLNAEERAQIDASLLDSQSLRDALAQEQALAASVMSGTTDLLDEAAPGFAQREAMVMQSIDSGEQVKAAPRSGFDLRATALAFLNPRKWNPAVSLALVLAILGQAVFIANQGATVTKLQKENFELASGPDAPRDRSTGIVLELKDDAAWKAVVALIDSEGLRIVESGAFGVLTVSGDKKGEARSALIERLRQSPLVESAEPEA